MHMRDKEFSSWAFHIDDNSLPVLDVGYHVTVVKPKDKPLTSLTGNQLLRRIRKTCTQRQSVRVVADRTVSLDFCRSRVNSGHLTPVRVYFNLRDGHVCQGKLLIHRRHDVLSSRVLAVRALCGFDFDGILNRSFFPVDISPTTWRDDLVLQYSWAAPFFNLAQNTARNQSRHLNKRYLIHSVLSCGIGRTSCTTK